MSKLKLKFMLNFKLKLQGGPRCETRAKPLLQVFYRIKGLKQRTVYGGVSPGTLSVTPPEYTTPGDVFLEPHMLSAGV